MIYNNYVILIWLSLLFIGCKKRNIGTRIICDKNLYAEFYEINPAGMDVCYLTDSLNFRFYVGRFDPENGNYKFVCDGDTIMIYSTNSAGYIKDRVNLLSIKFLQKQHKFE